MTNRLKIKYINATNQQHKEITKNKIEFNHTKECATNDNKLEKTPYEIRRV